ncbi:MAG: serine protease [Planctomycetota bacterium]
MNLRESYKQVNKSIVAFLPKYQPLYSKDDKPDEFPPIIGTGFIVNENGLVVTNDHVFKAIKKLWRPPDAVPDDWGVYAMVLHMLPEGQVEIPIEVIGVFEITQFTPGKAYYGPRKPDLAIVRVKARGLPSLRIDDSPIQEGMEVATAGFPMGTDALQAPGWIHQMTPTLQRGIVSAVLPFACNTPHAFTINVMTQGGASGSPVFYTNTGEVAGVLYGGLFDLGRTKGKDQYKVPTNISYVVPSHYIKRILSTALQTPALAEPCDGLSIEEMIETNKLHNVLEEGRQPEIRKLKPDLGSEISLTKFIRQDNQ